VDSIALSWLLAATITLLTWTSLPLWVLVSRTDPPVRLLVVTGPALGLLLGLAGAESLSEHVLMTSAVFSLIFWSSAASVLALMVFLQPGPRGSSRVPLGMPKRQQALELGLILGTFPVQVVVLPIPVMLATFGLVVLGWREVERAQRVRAQLSVLVTGALLACVLFLVAQANLCLATAGLFLLPLLGVPLLAWKDQGIPYGTLLWLVPSAALWLLGAGLELEFNTRLHRRLRQMDTSELPVAEGWGQPPVDVCVATPREPCPRGSPTLLVWPEDEPVAQRLLTSSEPTWVAHRNGEDVYGFILHTGVMERSLGLRVSRGEGLLLAGKPASLDELEEAQEACGVLDRLVLDPEVDWTAGELVSMCALRPCEFARAASSCSWSEGRYVRECVAGESCSAGEGGAVRCPAGGCEVHAEGDIVVDCASGCQVWPRGHRVDLRCEGGGCTLLGQP
jgi:hypothetical protein